MQYFNYDPVVDQSVRTVAEESLREILAHLSQMNEMKVIAGNSGRWLGMPSKMRACPEDFLFGVTTNPTPDDKLYHMTFPKNRNDSCQHDFYVTGDFDAAKQNQNSIDKIS